MLDPKYEERAAAALDQIEHDLSRKALWNAIFDAIDLVCDHPDSAEAQRESIRTLSQQVWQVPIRCRADDDDWVLWWRPETSEAHIFYIGPRL